MKQGLTIQEMSAEIVRQSAAKADYKINTSSLLMDPMGGQPLLRLVDGGGVDLIEPLDVLQTAHRQIGAFLEIPNRYYDKMLQEDTALLAHNVNRWFKREPKQRMIRAMDGHARAFLSNRYRRIDNLDIAKVTLPIIGEMQDARFESCQITPDYMYIKVVNPRLQGEVVPGDIVQAGVVIRNSETGLGAVSIQPLIYRLVCSNGMVVNDAKTRRHHIGRIEEAESDFHIYSQETLAAEDKAFVLKIQDTVRAAVDEARFAAMLDKMKQTTEARLNTADIPTLVKPTSSNFGITEDEGGGVLQYLIEGGDLSLYGLANAVTRFSQDVENYDRASKLEEIGYSVMMMPPNLFRKLNQQSGEKLAAPAQMAA